MNLLSLGLGSLRQRPFELNARQPQGSQRRSAKLSHRAHASIAILYHHSETLMIKGESYRLREKRKSGLFRSLDEAEARTSGRSQSKEDRPAVGLPKNVDK